LPVVGRPITPPAPGDAEGDGLAPGTTAPDAPGEVEGPALASADAPGDAGGTDEPGGSVLTAAGEAGAADAEASGDADEDGAPEAPGLGLAFGNSASPICSVRIRT